MYNGYSSRLSYDNCAYPDKLIISTGELGYRLSPDYVYSCSSCFSDLGPRSGHNGFGISLPIPQNTLGSAQAVVDVESVLTNRNMPTSKCKDAMLNPLGINQWALAHARTCNNFLNPITSHLTNPPQTYREMAVDRFFDTNKNMQEPIYWDQAKDTRLEAKDNFIPDVPNVTRYQEQPSLGVRSLTPRLPLYPKWNCAGTQCRGGH